MQTSRTSDWLQIAGTVGVIVGLVMVALEVRQANKFAEAEAIRGMYDGWEAFSMSGYETDIMDVYVKSFENPEELSTAEILKMDVWLTAAMTQYQRQASMHTLGRDPVDPIDDLVKNFDYYFGSRFARAWYAQARKWIGPALGEPIDREMESRPIQSSPSFIAEIRSQIRSEDSDL